ncbi:hypothetical protein CBR_g49477 [Chara braunii]|uniref:Cation/H+ exchanger transmembrane domain-containing protein n=1 Tax=Chara braunii TaxID=69332 RepID=A0A388K4Y1_CHABU|nr:hypothetical protein CBR_g49477 [Chara braunii]|eukprot:GBG65114.1 hypothetical protein CBR_g49477 [Chara braunii]
MGASSHAGRRLGHHPHRRRRNWRHPAILQGGDTVHLANGNAAEHAATNNDGGSRPKDVAYSTSVKSAGTAVKRNSETPLDSLRMQSAAVGSAVDAGGKLSTNTAAAGAAGAAGGKGGGGSDVKAGSQATGGGGGGKGEAGDLDLESGRWTAQSFSSGRLSAGREVAPRDPHDWLSSHHNPESPLNSAPSTGPNTPKGQEVIESSWHHWNVEPTSQTDLVTSGRDHDDHHEQGPSGGRGKGDPLLGGSGKKADEGSRWRRYWHRIGSAKTKKVRQVTCISLVIACIASWWGTIYLVGGESAEPNGEVFATISLLLVAYAAGEMTYRVFGIHPLLGSIAGGFILRYVPGVHAGDTLSRELTGHIRNLALVIILLRAGLSLDVQSLVKIPELCMVSPTVPLMVEASVAAALMAWLLNFSWTWAFMAGFVVSAVSPGVVVPILLPLAEKGYGVDAGIPSLVLAVAALCDVLALVGFSAFEEATFEGGAASMSVAHVCSELILGTLGGLLAGALITFLVPRGTIVEPDTDVASLKKTVAHDEIDGRSIATKRTVLLVGMGFITYYTFKHHHYTGAAAMAAFVMGIPPAQGWGRRRTGRTQTQIARVWIYVAQPLLFGVIGARLDVSMVTRTLLWKELVVLLVAGATRWVATVLVTSVGHLNLNERMFIASAWVSKATVQAAIGPTPLQQARAKGDPMEIANGEKVLVLATLAILLAAPTGAILSRVLGPKLLTKGDPKNVDLAGH